MQVSNVLLGMPPQHGLKRLSGELLESVGDAILALDKMGVKINTDIIDKNTGLNTATLVFQSGDKYVDVLEKGRTGFSIGKGFDKFEAIMNLLRQINEKTLGSFDFATGKYRNIGTAPKTQGFNLSA